MKKIRAKVKAAYARENRVRLAKFKEVEELTLEEAKEIVKWEKDKDRNHTIIGVTTGLISAGIWWTLLKDEQRRISEFEKYKEERTK